MNGLILRFNVTSRSLHSKFCKSYTAMSLCQHPIGWPKLKHKNKQWLPSLSKPKEWPTCRVGWHNKRSQTGWLITKKCILSQSWNLWERIQSPWEGASVVDPEVPQPPSSSSFFPLCNGFVELALVSDVSQCSTKGQKRDWNREVYYSHILGKEHSIIWGNALRGWGRGGRERQDPGNMLLLGPVDRVLWGYQSLTQVVFSINDSMDGSGCETRAYMETSGIAKVAAQIFSWCVRHILWPIVY